jgi:hypothetical protein
MAAQLCNSLYARLDSLPDDDPCVLYVVAGVKASLAVSAKTVPFMSPKNSGKYRQIYIIFGDGRDDPGAQTVTHNAEQIILRDNGIVAVTPSPLPLDDPSFYAIPDKPSESGGPLGKLIHRVISDEAKGKHGAVAVICGGGDYGSASAPPPFKYIHLASAVYKSMFRSVMSQTDSVCTRAIIVFAEDALDGASDTSMYTLLYPENDGCRQVHLNSLVEVGVSNEFGKLWFNVPCSGDPDPRQTACEALRRNENPRHHAQSPFLTPELVVRQALVLSGHIRQLTIQYPRDDNVRSAVEQIREMIDEATEATATAKKGKKSGRSKPGRSK